MLRKWYAKRYIKTQSVHRMSCGEAGGLLHLTTSHDNHGTMNPDGSLMVEQREMGWLWLPLEHRKLVVDEGRMRCLRSPG